MIGVKTLKQKANDLITAGGLDSSDSDSLSGVLAAINNSSTNNSVATISDLPTASNNKGRFIYVVAEQDFYYSNGTEWSTDYISRYEIVNTDLYGWGARFGSTPNVRDYVIDNFREFKIGANADIGVDSDNNIWVMGTNNFGQLGDGTTVNQTASPVTVLGSITDWSIVEAGGGGATINGSFQTGQHTIAARSTGELYAWGLNEFGQLGDGTDSDRSSPVSVLGNITFRQISAGGMHTMGIDSNGMLWGFGQNTSGQLGDGTVVNASSPVTPVGGITNWKQVSTGNNYTLAIANGLAYGMGSNSLGKLGDNSVTARSSPTLLAGGFTGWTKVSAGGGNSAGIANGNAYCWGDGRKGQLGTGIASNFYSRRLPTIVAGGITNWVDINANDTHVAAITGDGIAYGWGSNYQGRVGNGVSHSENFVGPRDRDVSSPVSIINSNYRWIDINGKNGSHMAVELKSKGF